MFQASRFYLPLGVSRVFQGLSLQHDYAVAAPALPTGSPLDTALRGVATHASVCCV